MDNPDYRIDTLGFSITPARGVAELTDWSDLPITLLVAAVPCQSLQPGIGDSEVEIVEEILLGAGMIVGYPSYPIDAAWFPQFEGNQPQWSGTRMVRVPLTLAARVPHYVEASTTYQVHPECRYLYDPNLFRGDTFEISCDLVNGFPIPNLIISTMTQMEYPLSDSPKYLSIRVPVEIFREWSEGDLPSIWSSEIRDQERRPCVQYYQGLYDAGVELGLDYEFSDLRNQGHLWKVDLTSNRITRVDNSYPMNEILESVPEDPSAPSAGLLGPL